MQEITQVGVHLAKRVIQVLAVNAAGLRVNRRALSREKFLTWCVLPPAVPGVGGCANPLLFGGEEAVLSW